jgi:putative transposase
MREIGNEAQQETGRWLNNRAENSHQPFRRRERAMAKFRSAKPLQKFAAVHASVSNHFNLAISTWPFQPGHFNLAISTWSVIFTTAKTSNSIALPP